MRPQACDPDVITSQTILPSFPFSARPPSRHIQLPPKPPPNLGHFCHVAARHSFKHRCAYVLSTGRAVGVARGFATVATARHSLADGASIAREIIARYIAGPPISFLLPSSPTPFFPARTMFVIKATLKDETRRLTFDTSHFPRYYEVQQKVSLT